MILANGKILNPSERRRKKGIDFLLTISPGVKHFVTLRLTSSGLVSSPGKCCINLSLSCKWRNWGPEIFQKCREARIAVCNGLGDWPYSGPVSRLSGYMVSLLRSCCWITVCLRDDWVTSGRKVLCSCASFVLVWSGMPGQGCRWVPGNGADRRPPRAVSLLPLSTELAFSWRRLRNLKSYWQIDGLLAGAYLSYEGSARAVLI